MRKQVPMLDDSLSKAEFLSLIPAAFQSVVLRPLQMAVPLAMLQTLSWKKTASSTLRRLTRKLFTRDCTVSLMCRSRRSRVRKPCLAWASP